MHLDVGQNKHAKIPERAFQANPGGPCFWCEGKKKKTTAGNSIVADVWFEISNAEQLINPSADGEIRSGSALIIVSINLSNDIFIYANHLNESLGACSKEPWIITASSFSLSSCHLLFTARGQSALYFILMMLIISYFPLSSLWQKQQKWLIQVPDGNRLVRLHNFLLIFLDLFGWSQRGSYQTNVLFFPNFLQQMNRATGYVNVFTSSKPMRSLCLGNMWT